MPISPKWNHSAPWGDLGLLDSSVLAEKCVPYFGSLNTGEEAKLEEFLLLSFLPCEVAAAPRRDLQIPPCYFWAWKYCEMKQHKGPGDLESRQSKGRCTFEVQRVREPSWMSGIHSKFVSFHTLGKSPFSDPASCCHVAINSSGAKLDF